MSFNGPICSSVRHNGAAPAPATIVDRVTPLPVTLEVVDGELWAARTIATQKLGRPNRHAEAKRDPWKQDVDAALAEQVVARHYGEKWTGVNPRDVDVGGIWEVRSIVTPSYGLVIRDNDRALPTFLVLVAERLATILGWEQAEVVRARGVFRAGSAWESDYWTLRQADLRRDDPPRQSPSTRGLERRDEE